MESFRTRIGKVTYKSNGFVLHNMPDAVPEMVSPVLSSFIDHTEDILDNAMDMTGYVIITFTPDKATIALRHAAEVTQHSFLVAAEHILRHFERYDNTPGD